MRPQIFVTMGNHNCVETLEEALNSLLAQIYQNLELIMRDDGSEDQTAEIAQKYAEKHPNKFKLIKNQRTWD